MPELPEVETTRRAIAPALEGHRFTGAIVREHRLRWPVPTHLDRLLRGVEVTAVTRRSKYLLLGTTRGTLLMHLGMSGSLRLLPGGTSAQKHDHLDLLLDDGRCLRLRDPRRFGSLHWTEAEPADHPLLAHLGPEPLDGDASALGDHLYALARGRRVAVKQFLMDSRVVVGVGNIYASESLFMARIDPTRAAGRVSRARYRRLTDAVRTVLHRAIQAGGTTLRDFTVADGSPGYFRQELSVYGRAGAACQECGTPVRQIRQGQRTTFYCHICQR